MECIFNFTILCLSVSGGLVHAVTSAISLFESRQLIKMIDKGVIMVNLGEEDKTDKTSPASRQNGNFLL